MKKSNIQQFLSQGKKGIYIGVVDHPTATPEDIKVNIPTIRVRGVQPNYIFGLSALVGEIYKHLKPSEMEALDGIVGKIVKSLYPPAKINTTPYLDIHGQWVYHTIAYLMDKVAENLGNDKLVWIIGEYPLDEENDLYDFLQTINGIKSQFTHYIITISYRPNMDFATSIEVDIPYRKSTIPSGKAKRTLTILSLLSYASYGYMRRQVAYELISSLGLDKGYIRLRDQGIVVETNGYIQIPDRGIWKEAIEKASSSEINEVIEFLHRFNSSASLYTIAHLYYLMGNHQKAMEYITKYLLASKEENILWQAQKNIEPLYSKVKKFATFKDWEALIDIASITGEVPPLVQEGIDLLLKKGKLSPHSAFNIAWLGKYISQRHQSLLIRYIKKALRKEDKYSQTILGYALLSIYFAMETFPLHAIQEAMLHIYTEELNDVDTYIKALITRSRIHIIFRKHQEALKDLLRAVQLALSHHKHIYLGTIYNNIVYTLKRLEIQNNIQLLPLQKKALESVSVYGDIPMFLSSLHNYVILKSETGHRYHNVINIIETAEQILMPESIDYKLRLTLSKASVYIRYGYLDRGREMLQVADYLMSIENVPRFMKGVYLLLRYNLHLKSYEIDKANYYLKLYTQIVGKDNVLKDMENALKLMKENTELCTLDSTCTYYTATRSRQIAEGIQVIKNHIWQSISQGNLLQAAESERYLANLYKLNGNISIAKKHMLISTLLAIYLGTAYANELKAQVGVPKLIGSPPLKQVLHILLDMYSSHVISSITPPSIEDLLEKITQYIPLPYFSAWVDLKVEKKAEKQRYYKEYILIKDIFSGFIKNPKSISRTAASSGISKTPSYIYVKVKEGNIILSIYMENPLIDNAFDELHLIILSIWSENIINVARKLIDRGKIFVDNQTGLYTSWYTQHILKKELERVQREKKPLSVIALGWISSPLTVSEEDIDQQIGNLIRENIRGIDIAGKIDKDTILIILPATPFHEAKLVAKRLIEKGKLLRKLGISLHAGVDCTGYPPRYRRFQSLISGSITAMRKAMTDGIDIYLNR